MKKSLFIIASASILMLAASSCERVQKPNITISGVDEDLYPGDFAEYTIPSFSQNTNTDRNILLEKYTGHLCGPCPSASVVAKNLEDANPDRLFIASIHAAPGGVSLVQTAIPPDYPTDFTTPEGIEIAQYFGSADVGFGGNPRGTISRIPDETGDFFHQKVFWEEIVNAGLESQLKVNLQAKSNYYPETRGLFLHVETEFLTTPTSEYNIVGYIIENKIIAPQLVESTREPLYEHHNTHIGNLFGETWGRSVSNRQLTTGTKYMTNYSYEVPEGLTNEEMHFLFFVYDKKTYEVMQVIKHEF